MSNLEKSLKHLNERIGRYEELLRQKQELQNVYPKDTSYVIGIHTLQAQIDDLFEEKQTLLADAGVEELDMRLHGYAVEAGTASITTIGSIFTKLQDVLDSLGAGLTASYKGRIKESVRRLNQLKMAEVYPGSFGFRLLSSNEQSQPEISDLRLIQDSMTVLFSILEASEDQEKVESIIENVAARTIRELRKFIDIMNKNQLEFDLKWIGQKQEPKVWKGSTAKISNLLDVLNSTTTIESCYEKLTGYIRKADAEEYKLRFKIAETGEYIPSSYKPELRKKVSETYDKMLVKAIFEKTTIRSKKGPERVQWLMTKLETLE